MSSSAADQWPKDRPAYDAVAAVRGPGFLPAGAGSCTRLVVAVLLGVAALLLPLLTPPIERTGAVFTDQERTSTTLLTAPTFPADPADPPPADPAP